MNKHFRFNLTYLILAVMGVIFLHDIWVQMHTVAPIPYSEFQHLLKENRVAEITVSQNHIMGTLKEPKASEKKQFVTARLETDLAKELEPYNVQVTRTVDNTLFRDILSWILPVFVFFGIWMFLGKRMGGGGGGMGGLMSIGKSRAKVYVETDTKVTFQDVAGVDEAKAELQEIVFFLKDPKRFSRLGGRMPKGVMLVGPPGTGKTLIAKAVAGEASVPFFSISGSEFVEMFVGVGAARVRDLFEQARKKAPAIIFIDELDALGRARSSFGGMGGHDEKEQTLNQLLVEMDGFDSSTGLILLAATNRPEILDPALLRAGRFDRQVAVDRPDKKGRAEILKVHIKKVILDKDVDLEQVAALTPGFTGADLSNLVNEAALTATRRLAESITLQDFTVAIERLVAGLEKKSRLLNINERKTVAYHEMGHALVAVSLPGTDPVHKVSIIPRGIGALGYTMQRPTDDRYLMTKMELENRIAVLMGGRASEKLTFNHLSTGASDDLSKATDLARNMVTRFGMGSEMGNATYDSEPVGYLGQVQPGLSGRRYSEETAREIDGEIRKLVDSAFDRALAILQANRSVLEEGAELLLAKETLDEKDFEPLKLKLVSQPV